MTWDAMQGSPEQGAASTLDWQLCPVGQTGALPPSAAQAVAHSPFEVYAGAPLMSG